MHAKATNTGTTPHDRERQARMPLRCIKLQLPLLQHLPHRSLNSTASAQRLTREVAIASKIRQGDTLKKRKPQTSHSADSILEYDSSHKIEMTQRIVLANLAQTPLRAFDATIFKASQFMEVRNCVAREGSSSPSSYSSLGHAKSHCQLQTLWRASALRIIHRSRSR